MKMRRMRATLIALCASLTLLASLASGCDNNVATGGAGGEPTPGAGDDDDDGSTPGATPTPGDDTPGDGAVPETIGGWWSLGNIRSQGNDPAEGVGGSGLFLTQAVPLFWLEPWEALFSGYSSMPLDTCDWGYGGSLAIAGDGQLSKNAGDVSLTTTGGSGGFLFLPLGGLQLYIANSMPGVFMPSGAEYTLSGTGDEVGAFSETFIGPPDVHVSQPNLTGTAGPMQIDRTQDMPLKWESPDDGLPLFVFLLQAENEDATPQVVVCRLENDGDATIPASAFQMFAEPGYGFVQSMQVIKYRIHLFTPPGAVAPVLVNFASGYNVDVTF